MKIFEDLEIMLTLITRRLAALAPARGNILMMRPYTRALPLVGCIFSFRSCRFENLRRFCFRRFITCVGLGFSQKYIKYTDGQDMMGWRHVSMFSLCDEYLNGSRCCVRSLVIIFSDFAGGLTLCVFPTVDKTPKHLQAWSSNKNLTLEQQKVTIQITGYPLGFRFNPNPNPLSV